MSLSEVLIALQIEELLRVEPYNAEYLEMAKSLDEVSTRRAGQIPADATSRSHSIHLPLGANPISDCTLSRLGARSEEFCSTLTLLMH